MAPPPAARDIAVDDPLNSQPGRPPAAAADDTRGIKHTRPSPYRYDAKSARTFDVLPLKNLSAIQNRHA